MGPAKGGEEEYITVVSGLPRSGTSMMMRMLEAGGVPALTDNVRKADADNPNGYYEFEPVKRLRSDTSWLEGAYGKAVKMVYLLLYDLPPGHEYRVVFMRRKLEEVIASQEVMLRRQGKQEDLGDDQKLMGLFRDQLARLDAWVRRQPNFKLLYVDYNELMEHPEAGVEEVNSFLGRRLRTDRAAQVLDRSLYRQRR